MAFRAYTNINALLTQSRTYMRGLPQTWEDVAGGAWVDTLMRWYELRPRGEHALSSSAWDAIDDLKPGCCAWPHLETMRQAILERLWLAGNSMPYYEVIWWRTNYPALHLAIIGGYLGQLENELITPYNAHYFLSLLSGRPYTGYTTEVNSAADMFNLVYTLYTSFVDISRDFLTDGVANWTKSAMEAYLGEELKPLRRGEFFTVARLQQMKRIIDACHTVCVFGVGELAQYFSGFVTPGTQRDCGHAKRMASASTSTNSYNSLSEAYSLALASHSVVIHSYDSVNNEYPRTYGTASMGIDFEGRRYWQASPLGTDTRAWVFSNPLWESSNCKPSVYGEKHTIQEAWTNGDDISVEASDVNEGISLLAEGDAGAYGPDATNLLIDIPPLPLDKFWVNRQDERWGDWRVQQVGKTERYAPLWFMLDYSVEGGLKFLTREATA